MNEGLVLHDIKENSEAIKDHAIRINTLEQRAIAVDVKIVTLCDQIKNLVGTLKWGFGILVTITLFVLAYLINTK